MNLSRIKLVILALAMLVTVGGAALTVTPKAHAGTGLGPHITVVADAKAYGVLFVSGADFSPNTTATIQVCDVATDAVIYSATTKINGAGELHQFVAFTVPSASLVAERVMVRVIDSSQAVSSEILVPIGNPVALAQQGLTAAQNALADALKKNMSKDEILQRQAAVVAAQQALIKALTEAAAL